VHEPVGAAAPSVAKFPLKNFKAVEAQTPAVYEKAPAAQAVHEVPVEQVKQFKVVEQAVHAPAFK